jgi:hypothetical protein
VTVKVAELPAQTLVEGGAIEQVGIGAILTVLSTPPLASSMQLGPTSWWPWLYMILKCTELLAMSAAVKV